MSKDEIKELKQRLESLGKVKEAREILNLSPLFRTHLLPCEREALVFHECLKWQGFSEKEREVILPKMTIVPDGWFYAHL